jgi:hypothetical protein
MPLPVLIGALVGAGLGYLGYREAQRTHQKAMDILAGMRTPAMEFWDEVQRLGIRQALEKYGYGQIRDVLEQAYRMQISSLMQRQARGLALSGVSPTRQAALVGRLRTPMDTSYLQALGNLPFDMMSSLMGMAREAGQQEYAKVAGLAGLQMGAPSLVQDLLSGITAGVGVGASVYQAMQPTYYLPEYPRKEVKRVIKPKNNKNNGG